MPFLTLKQVKGITAECARQIFLKSSIKDFKVAQHENTKVKFSNNLLICKHLVSDATYEQLEALSEKSRALNNCPLEPSFLSILNSVISSQKIVTEIDFSSSSSSSSSTRALIDLRATRKGFCTQDSAGALELEPENRSVSIPPSYLSYSESASDGGRCASLLDSSSSGFISFLSTRASSGSSLGSFCSLFSSLTAGSHTGEASPSNSDSNDDGSSFSDDGVLYRRRSCDF